MSEFKKIANAIHQLEYNVNLKRGIIYLEGEIDTYSAPFLLERVNAIRDLRMDEFAETAGIEVDDPINLYITSPGGDVNGLTALVDIMQSLTCKINTYAIGHAESAAIWVLAAGTGTRYIAPNTELMVHEMATWLKGPSSDIENDAKHIVTQQKNLYNLLGELSGKTADFWREKINKQNLYLTPETCIEYGLADKIILPSSL